MEDECSVLAAEAGQSQSQRQIQCRCRCTRGRCITGAGAIGVGVGAGYHMTALVPLLVLLTTICRATSAMCPTRCQCNDDELRASCTAAGLQVVPIQLNPELRHINLSHNKINNLHFTLEIYANLLTLDVSNNRIQKLGSMNFISQTHMISLNLSHNEIENLDKDAFKGMKALKVLDISSNHLEDISKNAFNDLNFLEELLLNDNRLVSFEPELFKHQSTLRTLQLDDNQLLEIPADNLVYTPNLESLSMSRNLVEYVEEGSLPVLNSLRYLALDTNVISEIHGSAFDSFTALEGLNLADNNFTSVPTTQLSKLSNLLELHLSGNFFPSIPPVAFRGLFKLRHLHLNGIETLARIDVRAFVDNINLETVSMNDNLGLNTIPTRLFHGNPRVTHISMRNNMFETIEASHFPLDQLVSLEIAENPLQCNCSLMWLWKLVTEQRNLLSTRKSSIENDTNFIDGEMHAGSNVEMTLDIDGIRCAGPEKLSGTLLLDAPESDIRCSLNWMAVATGSGTAMFVVAVVFIGLLYSGALRKCVDRPTSKSYMRRGHPSHDSSSPYQSEAAATSGRQLERDKCEHIISPPLLSEYQTLPTWESFAGSKDIDLYRQFGYHTNAAHPSRPHVVYV